MRYAKPNVTHNGTESGTITTVGANELVSFTNECVGMTVTNKGLTEMHITLNDETNQHYIPSGATWASGPMVIVSFKVVETGSILYYAGAVLK